MKILTEYILGHQPAGERPDDAVQEEDRKGRDLREGRTQSCRGKLKEQVQNVAFLLQQFICKGFSRQIRSAPRSYRLSTTELTVILDGHTNGRTNKVIRLSA